MDKLANSSEKQHPLRHALDMFSRIPPGIPSHHLSTETLSTFINAVEGKESPDAESSYRLAGLYHEAALFESMHGLEWMADGLYSDALKHYSAAAADETAPQLLRLKAQVMQAALPVYQRVTLDRYQVMADLHDDYLDTLVGVGAELLAMPPEDARPYVDQVTALLLLGIWRYGSPEGRPDRIYLPAVPRSAQHQEGWHLYGFRVFAKKEPFQVRIADEPDGRQTTIFPHELGRFAGTPYGLLADAIKFRIDYGKTIEAKEQAHSGRGKISRAQRVYGAGGLARQRQLAKQMANGVVRVSEALGPVAAKVEKLIASQIDSPRQPEIVEEYVSPYQPEIEWYLTSRTQLQLPEKQLAELRANIVAAEAKLEMGKLNTLNIRMLGWMQFEYALASGDGSAADAAELSFMVATEVARETGDTALMYEIVTEWLSMAMHEGAVRGEEEKTEAAAKTYRYELANIARDLRNTYKALPADTPPETRAAIERQLQLMTVCLLQTELGVVAAAPSAARLARRHDRHASSHDVTVWELRYLKRRGEFEYRAERSLRLETTDAKPRTDYVAIVAPNILKQHKEPHDFEILHNLVEEVLSGAERSPRTQGVRRAVDNRLWPERVVRTKQRGKRR